MIKHLFLKRILISAAWLLTALVQAQPFPVKPLRIVTSEPGGGNDFGARIIGAALTEQLGQQVLIENRGAAGGVIAAETVARAAPDGYTMLYYGSNIWLLPFLRDRVPYDPVRDLAPVTLAVRAPNILVVHPSLPVKTTQQLLALARARPGALNYGAGAVGSSSQIATELFKAMGKLDITQISYKGNGIALNALIAGEVQLAFATPGSVAAHIKSQRLRALAVTSPQPSPLLPGLPTVASAGLTGYEAVSIVGLFAPAKTEATLINRLARDMDTVLAEPDLVKRLGDLSLEPARLTPQQFGAFLQREHDKFAAVVKTANIKAE